MKSVFVTAKGKIGEKILAVQHVARAAANRRHRLHPPLLRVMHWVNAFAIITMIGSGWKIYNDEALFGWLHFPEWITIGGEAQGALQWHFLAMWILMLNGLCYLAYGILTGRFRHKLLPIRVREFFANVSDALRFRLSHDDITHYNAVQKLLYAGIIAVIVIQVISGWAVWKPMQLSELTSLFSVFHTSSFQGARLVHFFGMAAIVIFLVIHVALALLVPRTIGAMLTGGPIVEDGTGEPTDISAQSKPSP
jgi:thiosulfate reductase cytochrome b subunit